MFFLSCSGLGECGLVALLSPLPPSSVCLMLSDWRDVLGDGSVLLPAGLRQTRTSRDKMSFALVTNFILHRVRESECEV